MGEYSKRIGEIGEEIVIDFLKIIGWSNIQRNFDIDSVNQEKHGKKTNGIDGFFHYRSPMISNTIENIIISSKYSNEKYKNDPVKQFKEYYIDLACAIESFKKSELRNSTLLNHSNIETVFDRGLLFWLNNVDNDSISLIQKLSNIELPKDYYHDGIILIDNKRIEFFYDAIHYVKKEYAGQNIEFTYFGTGLNNNDESTKNGAILPIQYLTSNMIPMRTQKGNGEITFIICTSENFEANELLKIMGLAKNISTNMQYKTVIAFPNYNRILHEDIVNNTKQIFEEYSYTDNLTIVNFNPSFRG